MTNGERDHSNSSSETEQSETIPSTTEAVASSSANNVYANSNLEVAMSEFISQIVTPHAATIPTWNTYILLLSLYREFPDMIGHIACAQIGGWLNAGDSMPSF